MAKAKSKSISVSVHRAKPRRKRKGIHAKTKMSKCKTSKLYVKVGRGQG